MKKILVVALISLVASSFKIQASASASASAAANAANAAAHIQAKAKQDAASTFSSNSASAGSTSSSASCAAAASATPHGPLDGPLVVTARDPQRAAVWKFEKEASAAANNSSPAATSLNDWLTADPKNDIFSNARKMNVLMILEANQRSTQGNPFCHTKMGPNNLLVLVNASGMTEEEAADYQANPPKY